MSDLVAEVKAIHNVMRDRIDALPLSDEPGVAAIREGESLRMEFDALWDALELLADRITAPATEG